MGLIILLHIIQHSHRGRVPLWRTGLAPPSFTGCEARVEPQQALLFTEEIYWTQFPRLANSSRTPYCLEFDPELSLGIRTNDTLCSRGFAANEDLYGMGIRFGIYFQWLTALLVNNLLPNGRKELQKVYLIFDVALCVAAYVSSFSGLCVFGIEIEVLYWLYWGGVVCVFASSPSRTRLQTKTSKWIGLNWSTAIQYATNIIMVYHGIWFVWHAYDQVFARMPCGTYQFFFVPVLDPSKAFCSLRDLLMQLLSPLVFPFIPFIPTLVFVLASEINDSIQDSILFQAFFPRVSSNTPGNTQPVDAASAETEIREHQSLSLRILRRFGTIYHGIIRYYRVIRKILGLPPHRGRGIRLITPIDIKDRRYAAKSFFFMPQNIQVCNINEETTASAVLRTCIWHHINNRG